MLSRVTANRGHTRSEIKTNKARSDAPRGRACTLRTSRRFWFRAALQFQDSSSCTRVCGSLASRCRRQRGPHAGRAYVLSADLVHPTNPLCAQHVRFTNLASLCNRAGETAPLGQTPTARSSARSRSRARHARARSHRRSPSRTNTAAFTIAEKATRRGLRGALRAS